MAVVPVVPARKRKKKTSRNTRNRDYRDYRGFKLLFLLPYPGSPDGSPSGRCRDYHYRCCVCSLEPIAAMYGT